jgi:flagellar basal-body rod modification protein FlgD
MATITDFVNGTANTAAAEQTRGSGKKSNELAQQDFLTLMAAQLKNQDPFKALDPTQFLGQISQFSQVTGIQDLSKAFATFSDSFRSSQVLEGAALVGREVQVPANTVTTSAPGPVQGAVDVPGGARGVVLNVRDAAGQLIRTTNLPSTEGLNEFTWDGLTDAGATAPAGKYKFEVVANVDGKNESLQPLLTSKVQSVTIDPQSSGLVLNTTALGAVAIGDVRRVT